MKFSPLLLFLLLAAPALGLENERTLQPPDQQAALQFSKRSVDFIKKIKEEIPYERSLRLLEQGISIKDMKRSYLLLNSPIIAKEEDQYYPVRFMHAKHGLLARDCAVCHHYVPAEGRDIVGCSSCHQQPFAPAAPERPGLKAAYHLQCMACHDKEGKGPVSCTGCHAKKPTDHADIVRLPANPEPTEVTAECLRCHPGQGRDMLKTAHWLWRGPSPYTVGRTKSTELGKANAINNY